MKEFEEFIKSLILAEQISPDDDMVILNSTKNFGDYEIRVIYYDASLAEICSYSIETLIKNQMITFIFELDADINKHNILLRKFLNRKFKGTLSIEVISIKPNSVLTIKGNLHSIKLFLAGHKQIIVEYFENMKFT